MAVGPATESPTCGASGCRNAAEFLVGPEVPVGKMIADKRRERAYYRRRALEEQRRGGLKVDETLIGQVVAALYDIPIEATFDPTSRDFTVLVQVLKEAPKK